MGLAITGQMYTQKMYNDLKPVSVDDGGFASFISNSCIIMLNAKFAYSTNPLDFCNWPGRERPDDYQ